MAGRSERGQSSKGPTKSELLEMFLDAGLDHYEGIPLTTLTVDELHSIYQDIRKTENATKLKKDPMSGMTNLNRAEVDAVHEALTNVNSELYKNKGEVMLSIRIELKRLETAEIQIGKMKGQKYEKLLKDVGYSEWVKKEANSMSHPDLRKMATYLKLYQGHIKHVPPTAQPVKPEKMKHEFPKTEPETTEEESSKLQKPLYGLRTAPMEQMTKKNQLLQKLAEIEKLEKQQASSNAAVGVQPPLNVKLNTESDDEEVEQSSKIHKAQNKGQSSEESSMSAASWMELSEKRKFRPIQRRK